MDVLNSPSSGWDKTYETLFPRETQKRLSACSFYWRHSLPGTYQRSRLPEGGQVCGTDHMVCTDNLSTPSHSHLSLSLPIFHIQFRIFPSFYCDFFLWPLGYIVILFLTHGGFLKNNFWLNCIVVLMISVLRICWNLLYDSMWGQFL